jgi:hypothetical protein
MTRNGLESVRETEVIMRARLALLHSWQREVRAIVADVRATQTNLLALLAFGILLAGTVVLPRIAAELPLPAVEESRTRRLRRFLANDAVDVNALWRPIRRVMLAVFAHQDVTLVFDPTPQAGYATVLTVAVVQHHRALPVAWKVVPQQTSWPDTLDALLAPLLSDLADDLPEGCEVTLVVDRGITGPAIVRRCQQLGWHYTFRLNTGPAQSHRVRVDGEETALWPWLEQQKFQWRGPVDLFKDAGWIQVELTVQWDRTYAEPWILISDQPAGREQIRRYRRRARIEATFADTKIRGFDLERTKLRKLARIDRLVLAVALAVWWGTQLGLRTIRSGERRRFDRTDRRDKSVLRLGCQAFAHRLLNDQLPPLPFNYVRGEWRYAHYA